MSTRRKVKVAVSCRSRIPETSQSITANSQKKVTEYFPTIHRDQIKAKSKRYKEIVKKDAKIENRKSPLESPTKIARFKSPKTSPSEIKSEKDNIKLIEPSSSYSSTDNTRNTETIANAAQSDSVNSLSKKDHNADKLPSTEYREIAQEEELDKLRNDKKTAESIETEKVEDLVLPGTSKESDIDVSSLPSAVKLVESIRSATKSNLNESLPLPLKYERLLRLFDYTEMVVSWLETQGKRITLHEVLFNVQRKLKSNYGEEQFAQILSVYPQSYKIRCERRWMPIGGRHCSSKEFEYVIEPNIIDDLVPETEENIEKTVTPLPSPVKTSFRSPTKTSLISLTRNSMTSPVRNSLKARPYASVKSPTRHKTPMNSPTKTASGCRPKLEGRRLLRKLEFKNRLRKLVNIQHTEFLKGEGIEISPDEQLPRYHPDFDLESVDDIIPAKLPEIPKGDAGQPETMREYMESVSDSSSTLPDKIKKVIKELRSPEKQTIVVADSPIPLSPKKYSEERKNASKLSLLERIRAKERERKRREMLRNPEMEQKKERLERISRSLLQCVCSYYNLKKVGSMKFVELVDQLTFSIGIISKVEIETTISLLCEVCPKFFNVVEVCGQKYVQLKENNFSAIRDIIDEEIRKCL